MAVTLTIDDLTPWLPNLDEELAEVMIADALALAARVAPCILGDTLSADDEAAAKAVIRQAIRRWHDSGSGAYVQQTAGPISVVTDNRQSYKWLFTRPEEALLAGLCDTGARRKAFMVDMLPPEEGAGS